MHAEPLRYVRGLPQPGRALVMGVVNVTPDSFSDGGLWFQPDDAVDHGLSLCAAGADLLDVGGESTRPGAERPPLEEELRRVLPVVRRLADAGALVSVDTMRSEVAGQALDAGACMVNDVSGGRADPDMLAVVADADVPYVAMHWRAHSARMQQQVDYDDVVADVVAELRPQVEAALDAGVDPDHLVVDPGLGFAKTGEHNWQLLGHLDRLHSLGQPVLVGASRKAFLGALLRDDEGRPRPAADRDDASAVVSALAALAGVWCLRVHRVRPSLDAVRVASRWARTDH